MVLNDRDRSRLAGVHKDLVRVVEQAALLPDAAFRVTCGLRTVAEQKALFEAGKTRTMNSRHLTGHAVDLVVLIGGEISWSIPAYKALAETMKQAAHMVSVPIEWGGDWLGFFDGPHFQLPRTRYP